MVALYVLIGVTIFVTAIGIIGMNVIEKRQARLAERANADNVILKDRIADLEKELAELKAEAIDLPANAGPSSEEK